MESHVINVVIDFWCLEIVSKVQSIMYDKIDILCSKFFFVDGIIL